MAAALSLAALALAAQANAATKAPSFFSVPNTLPNIAACASEPSFYSCENTTAISNTCCSPTPGGLVLQTQFWDTWTGLEDQGQLLPKDSWGIHGLWPDFCDGSFTQYCDVTRMYDPDPSPPTASDGTPLKGYTGPSVETFIVDFKRYDLLNFMNKYWINQGAPNSDFWAHEFSKHATCTSTFDVACYGPEYKEHQDVIDFYDAVIRAFKKYPTWEILAASGIVPSNQTTYTLQEIQNALVKQAGALPYLGCGGNGTILQEVWYHHHVLGTEQFGQFKSVDTPAPTTCSSTERIWYYERTPTSEREVRLLP